MDARGEARVKLLLITPANPPSFGTYDAVLPTLERDCLLPDLSMPTLAGLTPSHYEISPRDAASR